MRAHETLAALRAAAASKEASLLADRDSLKQRVGELEEQNAGILDQFSELSGWVGSDEGKHVAAMGT